MLIAVAGAAILAVASNPIPTAPARYRIEQRTENRIDLSQFGQPEQIQVSTFAWYVTVSYTDSAGGSVLHAVLDSLQVDLGEQPVTPASLDSAKGTVYHGYASRERKIQTLSASNSSLYSAQFEAVLRSFHPYWRQGAGAGDQWTDTLQVVLNTPSIKTTSTNVRQYTVAGREAFEGAQATKLDVTYQEQTVGSLETPGGPADLTAKSTGNATWYIGPDGLYLGGKSTSQGDGNVTLAAAPSPIPVKSTTSTTVSVMK